MKALKDILLVIIFLITVGSYAQIETSYNCTPNGCIDPGDGSGTYCCLSDCEPLCSGCDEFNSWPLFDVDATGEPSQGSWCEWCLDYENNNFQNFNPTGSTWANPDVLCSCCSVEPIESYNCTVDGCVDPGDGSGIYGSMADCEAMCSCEVYDSWPVFDSIPSNPQQSSWCEWCLDYENPNSFYYPNFNPLGVNWANPDVLCDCCNSSNLNSIEIFNLEVFPNPSTDVFTVLFDSYIKQDINLVVYNILGEIVFSEDLFEFTGTYIKTIDIDSRSNSIYLLQIHMKELILTRKLMIQH